MIVFPVFPCEARARLCAAPRHNVSELYADMQSRSDRAALHGAVIRCVKVAALIVAGALIAHVVDGLGARVAADVERAALICRDGC